MSIFKLCTQAGLGHNDEERELASNLAMKNVRSLSRSGAIVVSPLGDSSSKPKTALSVVINDMNEIVNNNGFPSYRNGANLPQSQRVPVGAVSGNGKAVITQGEVADDWTSSDSDEQENEGGTDNYTKQNQKTEQVIHIRGDAKVTTPIGASHGQQAQNP